MNKWLELFKRYDKMDQEVKDLLIQDSKEKLMNSGNSKMIKAMLFESRWEVRTKIMNVLKELRVFEQDYNFEVIGNIPIQNLITLQKAVVELETPKWLYLFEENIRMAIGEIICLCDEFIAKTHGHRHYAEDIWAAQEEIKKLHSTIITEARNVLHNLERYLRVYDEPMDQEILEEQEQK